MPISEVQLRRFCFLRRHVLYSDFGACNSVRHQQNHENEILVNCGCTPHSKRASERARSTAARILTKDLFTAKSGLSLAHRESEGTIAIRIFQQRSKRTRSTREMIILEARIGFLVRCAAYKYMQCMHVIYACIRMYVCMYVLRGWTLNGRDTVGQKLKAGGRIPKRLTSGQAAINYPDLVHEKH
jgi:hypothetical protein